MEEQYGSNHRDRPHEELCDAFTSTISALAVDAAALRQLTSLRFAVGVELGAIKTPGPNSDDDENIHPNMIDRAPERDSDRTTTLPSSTATDVIDNLRNIDDAVTSLENKMSYLKEIIAEEEKALADLEEVKASADHQRKVIGQIVEGCIDLKLPGDQQQQTKHGTSNVPQSALKSVSTKNDKKKVVFSNQIEEKTKNATDNVDPILSLALVTESEFDSISRNIRGRIHLSVINNALAEIERVCRTKYAILGRTFTKTGGGSSGVSKKRTKQYQQTLASHRDVEVDEHGDRPWISEQDLRDSCAFFRSGESTARSIIQILRSLRRLKQVCGKNSQVTYVCLPSTSE